MMLGSWCGQVRSLQISSGLFRHLQVERSNFWSVWPSSVGHVPRGSMVLLSMRSCYFVDRDLRDHVNLVGRGFEPRAEQYDFCIYPGFDSQARSPVSGQCDPWPMSLAPTNGELGWCGKKPHGRKKKPRGVNEVTIVSVRLRWRGRLSIVGILV